jgi:PDZ domain-containing protein
MKPPSADKTTSLDAAMTILCHVGRRRRGASGFFRMLSHEPSASNNWLSLFSLGSWWLRWMARTRSARPPSQESLNDTIHSAITNPVKFAKARLTGGVGAVLLADPATGIPLVQNVVAGCPAEKAGLREGGHLIQVDGVATSGRTLAQNVESIRGFVAGSA